jgi:hypothetical protein
VPDVQDYVFEPRLAAAIFGRFTHRPRLHGRALRSGDFAVNGHSPRPAPGAPRHGTA